MICCDKFVEGNFKFDAEPGSFRPAQVTAYSHNAQLISCNRAVRYGVNIQEFGRWRVISVFPSSNSDGRLYGALPVFEIERSATSGVHVLTFLVGGNVANAIELNFCVFWHLHLNQVDKGLGATPVDHAQIASEKRRQAVLGDRLIGSADKVCLNLLLADLFVKQERRTNCCDECCPSARRTKPALDCTSAAITPWPLQQSDNGDRRRHGQETESKGYRWRWSLHACLVSFFIPYGYHEQYLLTSGGVF